MHALSGLIDVRRDLPRASWEIGRRAVTSSITVHWNGPLVREDRRAGPGVIEQLRVDCDWQMRPGWANTPRGADGLMYHLVVDVAGRVYQTRDMDALLWHCGRQRGNAEGVAVHLPFGEDRRTGKRQQPTGVQLAALGGLLEGLCGCYGLARSAVLGHQEWKPTACPGPEVMAFVRRFRGTAAPLLPCSPAPLRRFQVISSDALNVRQGPASTFPVAGRLKPGSTFLCDVVKVGELVDGVSGWAHMARVEHEQADLGFCSLRWLWEVG